MQHSEPKANVDARRLARARIWATIGLVAMAVGAVSGIVRLVMGETTALVILLTVLHVVGAASFAVLRRLIPGAREFRKSAYN